MSEDNKIDGFTERKEEGGSEIHNKLPGDTDNEIIEPFEFQDDTLQITDVHAFEYTVGEFPFQGTTELSSANMMSNESPASDIKIIDRTETFDTDHQMGIDLQSELAALGLNSLYPSARQDLDSNFEESFEQVSPKKSSFRDVEFGINNETDNSSTNSLENNPKVFEDMHDEKTKINLSKNESLPLERDLTAFNLSLTGEDCTEINRSNTSSLTKLMPDIQTIENNVEIIYKLHTVDHFNDCRDNGCSQSYSNDNAQDSLSTENIIDNSYDKFEENCYKSVADMFNSIQDKSGKIEVFDEGTDDIFEDAVDSFITNKEIIFSDGSKLLNCSVIANSNSDQDSINEQQMVQIAKDLEPAENYLKEAQEVEESDTNNTVRETSSNESFSENEVPTSHMQQSSPEKAQGETITMDTSLSECYIVKEFFGDNYTSPEEEIYIVNALKESLPENEVFPCQLKQLTEEAQKKIKTKEMALSENDTVKDTNEIKQTCPEEFLEEICTVNYMKELLLENEAPSCQMQQSTSEEAKEENLTEKFKDEVCGADAANDPLSENEVLPSLMPQLIPEEAQEENMTLEMSLHKYDNLNGHNEITHTRQKEFVKDAYTNIVFFELDKVKESNETTQTSHGKFEKEVFMSQNKALSCQIQISSSEEAREETKTMEKSLSEDDKLKEPHEIHQSSQFDKEASTEIVVNDPLSDNEAFTSILPQLILEGAQEDTKALEKSWSENDKLKEPQEIQQSPEEFNIGTNAEIATNDPLSVNEALTSLLPQLISEEVQEEARGMEKSWSENYKLKEPQEINQSSQFDKEVSTEIVANNLLSDNEALTSPLPQLILEGAQEDAKAMEKFWSGEGKLKEPQDIQQTSLEEFDKEANDVIATNDPYPENEVFTSLLLQSISEEAQEETKGMEKSWSEDGKMKELHEIHKISLDNLDKEASTENAAYDLSGNEALTSVLPQSILEEAQKETKALEKSWSENDKFQGSQEDQQISLKTLEGLDIEANIEIATNDPLSDNEAQLVSQQFEEENLNFSEEFEKETCCANEVKESFSENLALICQLQQSSSEEAREEIRTMKKSWSEDDKLKEPHEIQQMNRKEFNKKASNKDTVISTNDPFLDNDDLTSQLPQLISEGQEEILALETSSYDHDDVKEVHEITYSSPMEFVEETYTVNAVNENHSENKVLSCQIQQSISGEAEEETKALENVWSEDGKLKEAHELKQRGPEQFDKDVDTVIAINEPLSKNEAVTCQLQQSISEEVQEEHMSMDKSLSVDNQVKDTHEIKQTIPKDFAGGTYTVKNTSQMLPLDTEEHGERTYQIISSGLEIVIEEHSVSNTHEDNVEKGGFEEALFKTHNSSNEEDIEQNSLVNEGQVNSQSVPVSESSFHTFHCQQTSDMSLTIVGESANNLDTSVFTNTSYEEKCEPLENDSTQTLSDFLNKSDIKDTNDFIDHADQKMYDALYIPSLCNDNNFSVTENGLQTFMEMTMANMHVAMIDQTLNTTNQYETNHSKEMNSKLCESQSTSAYQEELNSSKSDYSSDFETESNHIKNKNHKVMQMSMSEYVTNLSLKLAIPDSYDFSGVEYADEETQKKCKEQTENVLLMKWPAQYHNDVKILNNQNHLLSKSINEKDILINKLKTDNEDLLHKLTEVIARSEQLDVENSTLKSAMKEFNEDKDSLLGLQQQNQQLSKDLEALKSIESELISFKGKNEELLLTIEQNRCAKESEIKVLKDRIGELKHELLNIGQTVIDLQSKSQEICILEETIASKGHQIEILKKDKSLLEEKISNLSYHNEALGALRQENHELNEIIKLEKEKSKDMEELKMMLEQKTRDICVQSEKLSNLFTDLNEKEQHIQDLLKDKVSLQEMVTSLNNHLCELGKFEDENLQLKADLQEEKNKREEIVCLNKSLMDTNCSQEENISKLNCEISEKDHQIMFLTNNNDNLREIIETLNQRLEDLVGLEKESEELKSTMKMKNEEIKEIKKLKASLEEQVSNLKAQNELLWDQLKVSSTKEQSLFALKEESILLEEKLSQMKREIQDINNLKSDNEHLVDELTNKDSEIRNLTADKKKLKSSLIKVNDKLNERDAEIEKLNEQLQDLDERLEILNEEKVEIQNSMDELKRQNDRLKEELNNEKPVLSTHISNISEYLSSVIFENAYLADEIVLHEAGDQKLTEEIVSLKKQILEEKMLVDVLQAEREKLLNTICNLKETVNELKEVMNNYKDQYNEVAFLKEENETLTSKVNSLNESVISYENEKTYVLGDMNSLSEAVSNLIIERQLLSGELKLGVELREQVVLLTAEKHKLEKLIFEQEQSHLALLQSNSALQDELKNVHDKDKVIEDLKELTRSLESHISSINEELMSELSKNYFLSATKNELEIKLSQNNKDILVAKNMISSLTDQLNVSREKICDLEELVADLENHMSSLNEELMSEIAKTHFLSLENETMALIKESKKSLTEENEILLKIVETHKSCEDAKSQLQKERSTLEMQTQTLTETIKVLRNEQYYAETQLKDSLLLKEEMTKEIHSLTGEYWDSKVKSIIEVYQKLMREFLNKEKEVIFSLQNDFDSKVKNTQDKMVSLKDELNEKDILASKLEIEMEECKEQLKHRDNLISSLENELLTVKNYMSKISCEIEEKKLQIENKEETLIAELNSVKTKLEERVSLLINEISSKNEEILQLKNDFDKIQCEKNNLVIATEEKFKASNHQQDLMAELELKLYDKQEQISQLDLQLKNKINETSQLTEELEKKEMEITQCLMKIDEMKPAVSKLLEIENELDLVRKMSEEFNVASFIDSLQTCQVIGDTIKLVVSRFVESSEQLQISIENLKLELSNQVEICKSLETQISDKNEELKSCKLLYDEDSLQFKEEIAVKNSTIANLTETLEQMRHNACIKTESTEIIKIMEYKLKKLEEENKQLQDESNKISYLTEVNRKLSWEIEELSRSIKFEKQSNIDLKAKCDVAHNQVADLSKKNFQLEDKIDVLEKKLENHDVISSLKIEFPLGINSVDKQVQYLNEKLAEFDEIHAKLSYVNDEYSSLKREFEKSKEYIKKQEEKLTKIMKRELDLKKQIASNLQTSPDSKILKELKTELLSLFPDKNISLAEALIEMKSLVEAKNKVSSGTEIEDLKQKIEELAQENKDLDLECESMNKFIEEQRELVASVLKREEEQKKLNAELKSQISNQHQINVNLAFDNNLQELFESFSEKPASLKDSINMVKSLIKENQTLKEKISESQEEYASLDKECEDMFKVYKEKEKELADVLKREASTVSILKTKQQELEDELKALSEELKVARFQLTEQNTVSLPARCQCEEFKSRLSELKLTLAERNAKITALEMQFEADNFPLKKKVADLEKSLDQAKHKVNELKSEVRRYRELQCDVTVGLRAECERCRGLGSVADPAAAAALQQQLQEKNKEIQILKALCKTRNQRIKELEERDGSYKMPRQQRSALKEVKENKAVPQSPTKPSKFNH